MTNVFDRRVSSSSDLAPENEGAAARSSEPPGDDSTEGEGVVRTRAEVRETCQELLRSGYVEEARKPEVFRRAVVYRNELAAALEPLDLAIRLDTHRGVAFVAVATEVSERTDDEEAAWAHPLVRRQRLTLEQSLLVALLRQAFMVHEQEVGVGQSEAKIAVDDLLPRLLTYLEDTGSDAKNQSRLLTLLDQLKAYGVVSEPDSKQELTIRPMIAHLANPESLAALLQLVREQAATVDPPEGEG